MRFAFLSGCMRFAFCQVARDLCQDACAEILLLCLLTALSLFVIWVLSCVLPLFVVGFVVFCFVSLRLVVV